MLTAVAFSNPKQGYGLYTRQGPVKCEDLVGATSDGGATFHHLVSATSWSCGENASARSLAFDDHGDGFLYGPDLFISHDDGAEWSASQQPGAVLAVQALGDSVWMVEAECPQTTGPQEPCPLRLLESNNGGRTWATSPVPANATLNNGLASESALGQTWLVRISKSSAYLGTNPAGNQYGSEDNAPLWFTSDGGRSWSNRQLPCAMDASSAVVSAAPDGALLAVCASQPGAGSQLKSTLRSTDGGSTWTVQSTCVIPSSGVPVPSCTMEPPTGGYLGGIDALSADTLFLVGDRSSLLVSHNGGVTWQPVQPLMGDSSDGTNQVIFFNNSDGLVLGYNGYNNDVATLWSTRDGGTKWNAVVPRVA
jgi:photosystem II stability/assembly factor-like uncharacterized protein